MEEYILDGNQVSWSRKLMELEQETDRAGTQSLLSVARVLARSNEQINDLHVLLTFFFQIHYMDDFFAQNGSKCLLFYYEETPAPTAVEGDHSLASSSHNQCLKVLLILVFTGKQAKTSKRLYLTDGTKEAFPGLGMFFLRTTTKPITTANIAQETYFGILESNGGGLLEAIETLLTNVFIPALQQQTNWGTLSTDSSGHMLKEAFLAKLSSFVSVLANARASIADAVKLSPCSNPQLAALSSPSEILAAASNPELVEAAESCTQMWCKEIEQVPPHCSSLSASSCIVRPCVADPDPVRTDAQGGR